MGAYYDFSCPKCGYSARVSGGDDFGMLAVTTTIVCEDCRELSDIGIGSSPIAKTKKPARVRLHCQKDKSHNVRRWKHPGACPKCGTTMVKPETIAVLWD